MPPISNVFNRDCMEAMREFPDKFFELAIVDPPYGADDAIGLLDNKKKNTQCSKRNSYKLFDNTAPEYEYYIELDRISKNQIVWGGNFLGLCGGVVVWLKNGTAFGDAEVAICSTHKSVKVFEYTWNGMLQADMKNKESRIHPTQKPIALYKWLLTNYAKPGDKILDTHLGSGSSRIAAWDMGFDFWGYEIDADYFGDHEKRFQTHISKPVLFAPEQMYSFEQKRLFENA